MNNEIKEDMVKEAMKICFDISIDNYLKGKYEPPDMLGKCVDDITKTWKLLLNELTNK